MDVCWLSLNHQSVSRSVDVAIIMAPHYILQHLDSPGTGTGSCFWTSALFSTSSFQPCCRESSSSSMCLTPLKVDHSLQDRQEATLKLGKLVSESRTISTDVHLPWVHPLILQPHLVALAVIRDQNMLQLIFGSAERLIGHNLTAFQEGTIYEARGEQKRLQLTPPTPDKQFVLWQEAVLHRDQNLPPWKQLLAICY